MRIFLLAALLAGASGCQEMPPSPVGDGGLSADAAVNSDAAAGDALPPPDGPDASPADATPDDASPDAGLDASGPDADHTDGATGIDAAGVRVPLAAPADVPAQAGTQMCHTVPPR